jgi:hypothetical protein
MALTLKVRYFMNPLKILYLRNRGPETLTLLVESQSFVTNQNFVILQPPSFSENLRFLIHAPGLPLEFTE